ncbi:glycosyltransferase family 2 protein [Quadrisphaera sp. DSM 44207]|uniref:glycosyltransferase family 2 protein n=1 Tax=Quadrisphaera sp. DSM 44207 TaxID=1881057 RepID=UPI000887E345|nr:glycosyltransferase family A protein [Quadrisphaera sp. DSM 44207]SDQ68262.1 Glycosyltransferase, GT2 family [Quadrisphaera sp. DSM 44207]
MSTDADVHRPSSTVVVAVLTYRRPELLARAVPVLLEQAAASPEPARVLVVDNDPAGSARPVVERWVGAGLAYAHEPRPGIAAARNRALDEAGDAEAIVFIDDDEVPREDWLARLVRAWRAWGCTAVAGPAVSAPELPLDPWVRESRMFERRRRPTGTALRGAATNNLLLDLRRLRALGVRFDDAFGLTGGSDTMLTHDLVARGEPLRWCDEAQVVASVPAVRATRRYVLRRNLRTGTTWSRVEVKLARGPVRVLRRAELVARGVLRVARGLAAAVRGRLGRSLGHRARGECDVASGVGMVLGALGYGYVEYARPRGAGSGASGAG